MKKILIGLSGLVILAFIVIIAVNAQSNTQDKKKDATEVSRDASKCPAASACGHMKDAASGEKKCDPAKCKEKGCDPAKCKEGKCDHATCKTASATAVSGEAKQCCQTEHKCCSGK